MKKLFVLGLVLTAMSAALALPTVWGVSGGFFVPSTTIQSGLMLGALAYLETDESTWPVVQANYGLRDNLEIGAGYFNWGSSASYNINAKYLLPWTIAKAKLGVAGAYMNYSGGSEVSWQGQLFGSWACNKDVCFTAGVACSGGNETYTTYYAGLVKSYKNGAALGVEYLIHNDCCLGWDDYIDQYGDFGTLYVDVPVAENLTARFVMSDIANTSDIYFYAQVGAKF